MSWDPNPETDIAGYRVQYGTSSGDLSTSQEVRNSTETTLSNLVPEVVYYCAVRAFNTAGLEGPLSSEISFVIPAAPQLAPEIAVELASGSVLTDAQGAVNLGQVSLGSTGAVETFVIRNLGTADVTNLAIYSNNQEFAVTLPAKTTLAPGESAQFQITFSPSAAGTRTALVRITSNNIEEKSFQIALTGNGIASPEIEVRDSRAISLASGAAAIGFSGVNLGSTSATQTFTISNTGNAPLTDLELAVDEDRGSDFIVTAPAVTSLEPGGSTTFQVVFRPDAAGLRGAVLHIFSNDADENPFDIALAGTSIAIPDIAIIGPDHTDLTNGRTAVNLGNFNVGESCPGEVFTVTNLGTTDLSDLEIALDGPAASDYTVESLSDGSLPPGASTTFRVIFSPTAGGLRPAILRIASNDPDQNSIDIGLTGVGIAFPAISVAGPDSTDLTDAGDARDFGGIYIAATTEPQTFTISNTGTAVLGGLAISTDGANAADFIASPLGVTSLAPGSSTTFRIAFQPSAEGARSATLHIASDDPTTNSFEIALNGRGLTIPILAVESVVGTPVEPGGAGATFSRRIIGTTGETVTYVVRNTGAADLTGLRIALNGLHASSFMLDLPSDTSLASGASMSFSVTFKPTGVGPQSAAIQVTSDSAVRETLEIRVNGIGIAVPEIHVHQDDGSSLISGSSTVSFGNCDLGSTTPARTFTLKNTGSATLSRISIASDGPDFNVGSLGATSLPPGASTTFKANFHPTAVGTRGARVLISSNATDGGSFLIDLTGKGIGVPEIAVECGGRNLVDEKAFINFGTMNVGSTGKSQTLRIRNTGTAKLDRLAITLNGINPSDFTVSALQTQSLAPGASTTIKVTFRTGKTGIRWGSLHITSNDANESPFDIILTGIGRKTGSAASHPASATTRLTGGTTRLKSSPVKAIEVINGRKYLTLTIAKTPGTTVNPGDIEVSSNLVDWASGRRHTTVLSNNAKTLKVRDNTPISRNAKRHIRVKQ